MGFKSFLKGSKEKPKLLIGGGAELELPKHFRLLRKLGHGSFATVWVPPAAAAMCCKRAGTHV